MKPNELSLSNRCRNRNTPRRLHLEPGDNILDDRGRRSFLKRAALGGGGALLAGVGSYAFVKSELKGKPGQRLPHDR